jgi:hypothetical protein
MPLQTYIKQLCRMNFRFPNLKTPTQLGLSSLWMWNSFCLGAYRIIKPSYFKNLKSEEEFYSAFIKPGNLCFDIGANLGKKKVWEKKKTV